MRKAFPAVREIMQRECPMPPHLCDGSMLMNTWGNVLRTEPGSNAADDALGPWLDAIGVIDKHLVMHGPFFCGESLGAADFEVSPLLSSQLLQARVW